MNVSEKKEKDDTEKQTRINTMNRPSSQISLGFLGSWAMPHTAMWYYKSPGVEQHLFVASLPKVASVLLGNYCCSRLRNSCLMKGR